MAHIGKVAHEYHGSPGWNLSGLLPLPEADEAHTDRLFRSNKLQMVSSGVCQERYNSVFALYIILLTLSARGPTSESSA